MSPAVAPPLRNQQDSGMPGTSSETFACGRKSENETRREPGARRTSLLLSSPPPPSGLEGSFSPSASGGQCNQPEGRMEEVLPDLSRRNQYRPSVLRQGKMQPSKHSIENGSRTQPILVPESESQDPGPHWGSSPPAGAPSPGRLAGASSPLLPLPSGRGGSLHPYSQHAMHPDHSRLPATGGARGLFVSGLCRWLGCGRSFEDISSLFIHLQGEHGLTEQSLTQYRSQQDMVHYLERKLTLEKQRLRLMERHISDTSPAQSAAYDWSYSLALYLAPPPVTDGVAAPPGVVKDVVDFAQQGCWPNGPAHLLPDYVPSIECYKYNNIRPPYTYAYLIRWSILESPLKQRSLNEIYTWFSTMFFYFRHNTATWKNAVRHNLSLHTCFVRMEGGKGAVWTVDEREFQRRKGPKYHRDQPGRLMSPYSHFRPGES
ncbi:forkhead box protein P3 isoform X1 [Gadus macrocephalus]|uniref:forkhead box protein P3 isoform X1 n=4 Tax=Gadus macrocephalus TaxID=80720 RepID=UPI0028CB7A60|nr:forkhead box protein P3 isoform X1 [Gadus macrocephalus]